MIKNNSIYDDYKDILERIEINGKTYTFLKSEAFKEIKKIKHIQYYEPDYIDRVLNNYDQRNKKSNNKKKKLKQK